MYGFVKVAAATPDILVADCKHNIEQIKKKAGQCEKEGVKIVVFPELCITGYTCGDLFLQDTLLREALEALEELKEKSKDWDLLCFVGLPYIKDGKLYNTAAAVKSGRILGLVPKKHIPNYSEFYEGRYFSTGNDVTELTECLGENVPFGTNLLFCSSSDKNLIVAAEICEDLWVSDPPSSHHAMAGASIIVNLSASDELTGKDEFRRQLVKSQSARQICAYIYADAGEGESTGDLVFAGHNMIVENGTLLIESERFINQMVQMEIDLDKLKSERRRLTTFEPKNNLPYEKVFFTFQDTKMLPFIRTFEKHPFVPSHMEDREKRCKEIIMIQAMGLKKRILHSKCQSAVLGISGGLDSTLALLVTVKTFDFIGLDRKNIIAVTMPCFGTTDRTYQNAVSLTEILGASLKEIPIEDAVLQHFKDIGQDSKKHDVTYENSQARERTQVLMDIANQYNGIVVGTGDMSELALGWATYNGDHMSMYGVNSSVPKTLVRYLVDYFAKETPAAELKNILNDILDTPVSPELLPPSDGEIVQKTEDIVGPYELHDFFLYYVLRFGYEPDKIFHLALQAFCGIYKQSVIYRWLQIFYKRFFTQQFKRSCLPDGPKVGTVAVSPRGDLRMPSDAVFAAWQRKLDSLDTKDWTE